MATQLQLRRGTTTEHSTFVGAVGEVTVDTTKDTLVVHDGATTAGFPLAKESTVTALDSAAVHKTGDETVSGTKTFSSNPVLSTGTANGVAYLNGSKVLTTGSALTFDGTSLSIISSGVNRSVVQSTNNGGYATWKYVGKNSTGGTTSFEQGINIAAYDAFELYDTQNSHVVNRYISGASGYTSWFQNGSEQMRLTSTGLGIGTSSPASKLHVAGQTRITGVAAGALALYIPSGDITFDTGAGSSSAIGNYGDTGAEMRISTRGITTFRTAATDGTNGTERMRIDSSGNLLVGSTTSSARLFSKGVGTSASTYTIRGQDSAGTDLFYVRDDGYIVTGASTNSPYNLTSASAANLRVESNGELRRSTSSLKYKTDVKDSVHGLADVLKLRPVTYKGKNDGDKVFGGLIAEEVDAAGLTEFVDYAEDGSPDALAYSNMVSLCIKAIQELKAELDATKAEVAALKGN